MALSLRSSVQQAVLANQSSPAHKAYYLDHVIHILALAFPNTWNHQLGPAQGHGYQSWEQCGAVLPHVRWLMALTEKHALTPTDANAWAELLFRCGT